MVAESSFLRNRSKYYSADMILYLYIGKHLLKTTLHLVLGVQIALFPTAI
jgi:hypothetical protein